MQVSRVSATGCVVGRAVFVIGGQAETLFGHLNSIEWISVDGLTDISKQWQLIQPSVEQLFARSRAIVCPHDTNELYILGGTNTFPLNDAYCVKVSTRRYKIDPLADYFNKISYNDNSAFVQADGQIFVCAYAHG